MFYKIPFHRNTKYLLVQNTLAQNAQYLALSTLALQMPLQKILNTPLLHNTFIIVFCQNCDTYPLSPDPWIKKHDWNIGDCRMIGSDKVIVVSSIWWEVLVVE